MELRFPHPAVFATDGPTVIVQEIFSRDLMCLNDFVSIIQRDVRIDSVVVMDSVGAGILGDGVVPGTGSVSVRRGFTCRSCCRSHAQFCRLRSYDARATSCFSCGVRWLRSQSLSPSRQFSKLRSCAACASAVFSCGPNCNTLHWYTSNPSRQFCRLRTLAAS